MGEDFDNHRRIFDSRLRRVKPELFMSYCSNRLVMFLVSGSRVDWLLVYSQPNPFPSYCAFQPRSWGVKRAYLWISSLINC